MARITILLYLLLSLGIGTILLIDIASEMKIRLITVKCRFWSTNYVCGFFLTDFGRPKHGDAYLQRGFKLATPF